MQTKKIIYSKKAATSCNDLFAVDSVAMKRNFSPRKNPIPRKEKNSWERERVSASEEIRQRAVRDHLSVAAARRKSVDKKRFRAVHWLADTRQESQTSSNQKITSSTTFLDTLREKNQQQKKNFF